MSRARRLLSALVVVLVLGIAGFPYPDAPEAEAVVRLRAKVEWEAPSIAPELSRNPDETGPFVLFRPKVQLNTLTRQSNSDILKTQIVPVGTTALPAGVCADGLADCTRFTDTVKFRISIDIADAVIRVNQPAYQVGSADGCHVTLTGLSAADGTQIASPPAGTVSLNAGALAAADGPFELTIESRIPARSQPQGARLLTPRVLTSIIRVGDRSAQLSTAVPGATATPTPTFQACALPTFDRPMRSMNRAIVVRTELQAAEWAKRNARPTPTPIVIR